MQNDRGCCFICFIQRQLLNLVLSFKMGTLKDIQLFKNNIHPHHKKKTNNKIKTKQNKETKHKQTKKQAKTEIKPKRKESKNKKANKQPPLPKRKTKEKQK